MDSHSNSRLVNHCKVDLNTSTKTFQNAPKSTSRLSKINILSGLSWRSLFTPHSGPVFFSSGSSWASSWGCLGVILGRLGASWARLGHVLGRFRDSLRNKIPKPIDFSSKNQALNPRQSSPARARARFESFSDFQDQPSIWNNLGATFAPFWLHFLNPGTSWEHLGAPWGDFVSSWGRHGCVLGAS